MISIFHPANERGGADHGWLKAKHSFSFASWYNPEKIQFGALRVLNDDWIAPAMGFGRHPHDNMEIITIPLSGSVRHEDSMGNKGVISTGEIQIMSAGMGVTHSEHNGSKVDPLTLFQIWIMPKYKDVEPRYQQVAYEKKQGFTSLVGNEKSDMPTWIHQDAVISIFNAKDLGTFEYDVKFKNNGVYFLVIEGEAEINGQKIKKRDALGVSETEKISGTNGGNTSILVIEVPMK